MTLNENQKEDLKDQGIESTHDTEAIITPHDKSFDTKYMILYKNLFHNNPKVNKSLFDLIYILKVDYKIVFTHQTRTELA